MILGVMQPYFFPYLGYFDLINRSDRWVVFDPVQYIRHGWMNRNRILHPTEGWQYVAVPLKKHSRDTLISDIEVQDGQEWRGRILRQLEHYKKSAPHYEEVRSLVADCLPLAETKLSRLNTAILGAVCRHVGIRFEYEIFSDMQLDLPPIEGPGEWALHISEVLGAKVYINPPGGEGLFDKAAFASRGIELRIQRFDPIQYSCPRYKFEPNLSIIDVLMWCSVDEVRAHLELQKQRQEDSSA